MVALALVGCCRFPLSHCGWCFFPLTPWGGGAVSQYCSRKWDFNHISLINSNYIKLSSGLLQGSWPPLPSLVVVVFLLLLRVVLFHPFPLLPLVAGTAPSFPPWRPLSPPSFEWWCSLFHLLLSGAVFPPCFAWWLMWWSPLLLLGGAVSPSFLWVVMPFPKVVPGSENNQPNKFKLHFLCTHFGGSWPPPPFGGGCLPPPPLSGRSCLLLSSFAWHCSFPSSLEALSPPPPFCFPPPPPPCSLDWCCSAAWALDFLFCFVFFQCLSMFVFFLRIIFLLVFPGSAFYFVHFLSFQYHFSCFSFSVFF